MISYRADGRVLTVSVSDLGENPGALRLSVIIDRRDTLDASHVVAAGRGGWRVTLPAELCDGTRHRVALDIASDEQSLDRVAFSFAASPRTVTLRRREVPARH